MTRRLFALALPALALLATAGCAAHAPVDAKMRDMTHVEEVRRAIETQVAAWNRGDLDGFCALYAEDALFVSPAGLTRGRALVRERYEKKYGTDKSSMGTLAIEVIEARALDAGAVSVAAKWTLEWSNRDPATGHTLIVFTRRDGSWQLVQDASL